MDCSNCCYVMLLNKTITKLSLLTSYEYSKISMGQSSRWEFIGFKEDA